MNSMLNFPSSSQSSLWINNLIHGLSGLTIKAKHTVFCDSSPFQKVEVFDTYSFGLVLCLGGTIVMTEYDCGTYSEMMVHPALLAHKKPERVCIIGGGDGGSLREVLKYDCVRSVVVVEIDSLVTQTIDRFFPQLASGFNDSRTELVVDDGFHFLSSTTETFDCILVDSYDPGGPVQSLETVDFYQFVAERLNDNGVAVIQTDSPTIRSEFLRQTILSVSPLFAQYKPYICTMRSFPEGVCSFLLCAKETGRLDGFDRERFDQIADQLCYYNDDIHIGAFLLPQHIKKLLE